MPNVYLQSAPYQPFTYEELAKPLERLQALHDKVEETYTTMGDNAEQIKSQIGDDNPYALSIYNNYEKTFMDAYNSFAQNGVQDPNTRTQLLNARKAYMNDMGRLSSAITQRQNDLKTAKDAYVKNPNLQIAPVSNLDSYLQGTQTPYVAIDANDVYKRSKEATEALSKTIHTLTEQQRNGLIYTIKTTGIQGGPAAIFQALEDYTVPLKDEKGNEVKDENGNTVQVPLFPEFTKIKLQEMMRLKSQGLDYLADAQQYTLGAAVQQGMLAGMVSDIDQNSKTNPYALANYKFNLAKELYDYKHRNDLPNGNPQLPEYSDFSLTDEERKKSNKEYHAVKGAGYHEDGTVAGRENEKWGYAGHEFLEKIKPRMSIMHDDKLVDRHEFAVWMQKEHGSKATQARLERWYDNNVQPMLDALGAEPGMSRKEFNALHNRYMKTGGVGSSGNIVSFNYDNAASKKIVSNLLTEANAFKKDKDGKTSIQSGHFKEVTGVNGKGIANLKDVKISTDDFNNVNIRMATDWKDANGNPLMGYIVQMGGKTYFYDYLSNQTKAAIASNLQGLAMNDANKKQLLQEAGKLGYSEAKLNSLLGKDPSKLTNTERELLYTVVSGTVNANVFYGALENVYNNELKTRSYSTSQYSKKEVSNDNSGILEDDDDYEYNPYDNKK